MSEYNIKELVEVKITYLDEQEVHYSLNLPGRPILSEGQHPAIVFDNITLDNVDYLLVGKVQSYYENNSFMVREESIGRATVIKGEVDNMRERNPNPPNVREGVRNDSYFFSGEIYLVETTDELVQRIGSSGINPSVLDRTLLKSSLLVSENYTSLMNEPFMEYIFKKHVVDNIEHLDINDIKAYNNILSSNVLESTQFIDNAIYRNRDTINQLVNYEDYQRVLKEYPKCICKIKEFILENEHLIDTKNPQGYLKELNERYNVYEAYNEKFVRDLNNNVGQFLRENDILPEQVEKFSIGYFTNLSTRESIETFKNQITNESLLSELNISDIDFDEKILEDRLTIPITNKYDRTTGFVAIDYTGDKDIPIIYSKSIDDPALRIDNNVFNLNRVDSNTITLVDNPLDVIKLDSLGINNAVCYLGNDYNDLAKQLQDKGINEVNISFKNNYYYEIKALDIGKSLNDLNINTYINLYNEESIRDNFNFNEPNFINYNDFSNNYYQKLTQNPYANMNDIDLTIELESNINKYVDKVLIPKAEKFCDISYIDSQTIKTNLLINDSISNPQGLEYLSNIRLISTVSNTNPNDITKKIENKFNEEAKERNLDLDLNNNRIMQQQEIEIDIMR